MKEVAYVNDESSRRAREFESRFQKLQPGAGILCVGVVADPIEGGQVRTFTVFMGVSRSMEIDTGIALIKQTLAKEIGSGLFSIKAHVFKGVSGTGRDQASTGPRTLPA